MSIQKQMELDQLMFHLDQTPKNQWRSTYLKAGKLLVELGLLPQSDQANIPKIVAAYDKHLKARAQKNAVKVGD